VLKETAASTTNATPCGDAGVIFIVKNGRNLKCIMKVQKKKHGTSGGFELATSNRNDLNKISTYLYRI
jgi:hypothetical protein